MTDSLQIIMRDKLALAQPKRRCDLGDKSASELPPFADQARRPALDAFSLPKSTANRSSSSRPKSSSGVQDRMT